MDLLKILSRQPEDIADHTDSLGTRTKLDQQAMVQVPSAELNWYKVVALDWSKDRQFVVALRIDFLWGAMPKITIF